MFSVYQSAKQHNPKHLPASQIPWQTHCLRVHTYTISHLTSPLASINFRLYHAKNRPSRSVIRTLAMHPPSSHISSPNDERTILNEATSSTFLGGLHLLSLPTDDETPLPKSTFTVSSIQVQTLVEVPGRNRTADRQPQWSGQSRTLVHLSDLIHTQDKRIRPGRSMDPKGFHLILVLI